MATSSCLATVGPGHSARRPLGARRRAWSVSSGRRPRFASTSRDLPSRTISSLTVAPGGWEPIDPDHFALQIEERPTRVAWVDRSIRLQEVSIGSVGAATRSRATLVWGSLPSTLAGYSRLPSGASWSVITLISSIGRNFEEPGSCTSTRWLFVTTRPSPMYTPEPRPCSSRSAGLRGGGTLFRRARLRRDRASGCNRRFRERAPERARSGRCRKARPGEEHAWGLRAGGTPFPFETGMGSPSQNVRTSFGDGPSRVSCAPASS